MLNRKQKAEAKKAAAEAARQPKVLVLLYNGFGSDLVKPFSSLKNARRYCRGLHNPADVRGIYKLHSQVQNNVTIEEL